MQGPECLDPESSRKPLQETIDVGRFSDLRFLVTLWDPGEGAVACQGCDNRKEGSVR